MQELREFILFFLKYCQSRVLSWGKGFERIKDVIVAFLIVKRGKYSNSLLNTSFFLLVAATIIAGPAIAQNNPFANSLDQSQDKLQANVVSYNPAENTLGTVISSKPRDKVIDYKVASGDTLNSISKKFGISIATIKWANDMTNETIKPAQMLKIAPVTGIVHKVQSGDSIYSIAKKYKVDAQVIVNFPFNDFADLETFALTPGQTIIVPGGVIEQTNQDYVPSQFYAQAQAGVRGSSNFIWPTTGIITQYPIWYHMAADIANNSNPPVIAADTGTVIFAGCIAYGYGCHVIIDHGNGYKSLYGHMIAGSITVSTGQAVSQGQRIGTMGSTGRSTGTHLHFEIRLGETLLNPLDFLK